MSEHIWFQENLAGYSADGLSIEERERFDRHRVACSACAQMLAEASAFDESMANLFAPIRPAPGFENRVIENLRAARPWRGVFWSRGMRIAIGVAALVVLGVTGAVLQGVMAQGDLALPGTFDQYASNRQNIEGYFDNVTTFLRGDQAIDSVGDKINTYNNRENKMLSDLTDGRTDLLSVYADDLGRVHTSIPGGIIGGKERLLERELVEEAKVPHNYKLSEKLKEDAGNPQEASSRLRADIPIPLSNSTFSFQDSDTKRPAPEVAYFAPSLPMAELGVTIIRGTDPKLVNEAIEKITQLQRENQIADSESREAGQPKESKGGAGLGAGGGPGGGGKGGFGGRGGANASNETITATGLAVADPSQKKDQADPELPPENLGRKIIRTGEIEFEVDGFDAAVAGITRLVGGVPGGFVATVNSDKLPNGKVKGSMVVRLPPEKLDKFLLDVRQELGKIGELKSQRIGSQDVSKQYTDITSRLRGARAMEERFLQIIKTGKGDIKDLVAAENALGQWRTKIEEMEGEIRFYNNQVGLSTLTITLYEKEIQAPAALIVTERRKIQLEVDDVEKAQAAVLAAVNEAKGRVSKSELKQHAAGQLEAIVHFEVAPAAANKVSDQLKLLGIITHQDADRSQQTKGAASQSPDIKIKQNDVKFEVGLYNSANVKPREILEIKIASLDVPSGFRKLHEAVVKVKGQVRTGQLNEQDKLNITAQFDFDIPSTEKKAIEQVLAEAGKVLSRNTNQAAPGEAATDRKIGYRLVLQNVAALPSREKISLGLEVQNVKQTAVEILEMVKSRQGQVGAAKMSFERDDKDSAILIFDVPLSAKDELLRQLKTVGKLRLETSASNPQVPDNELATARIDVTLVNTGPIVQELGPQVRTSLFYSFKVLTWSLMLVILGLSVVLPWVLILWLGYKVVRKFRKKPAGGVP